MPFHADSPSASELPKDARWGFYQGGTADIFTRPGRPIREQGVLSAGAVLPLCPPGVIYRFLLVMLPGSSLVPARVFPGVLSFSSSVRCLCCSVLSPASVCGGSCPLMANFAPSRNTRIFDFQHSGWVLHTCPRVSGKETVRSVSLSPLGGLCRQAAWAGVGQCWAWRCFCPLLGLLSKGR